jgi:hypothetical protein
MKYSLGKKVLFSLLIFGLIGSVSAFSYDFQRSSVKDTAEDSTLSFSKLNPNTEYTLNRGVPEDSITAEKRKTFTTGSTGTASFDFDFKPIADGYTNLTNNGFYYQLTSDSDTTKRVDLYPSLYVQYLDTFNDGNIDSDLWSAGGGESENNGELKASDSSATINFQKSINTDKVFKGYISEFSAISCYINVAGYQYNPGCSTGELTVYYKGDKNDLVVKLGDKVKKKTVSNLNSFSVDFEANLGTETIALKNSGVVPKSVKDLYSAKPDKFAYKPESGLIQWSDYQNNIRFTGTPGIQFASSFTNSTVSYESDPQNLVRSNALNVRTTGDGVVEYFSLGQTTADGFGELSPDDNLITTKNEIEHSFKWDFGNYVEAGDLRLQYNSGDGWKTAPAEYSSSSGCDAGSEGSTDAISVGTALFSQDCEGSTITATSDEIATVKNSVNWRFQVYADSKDVLINSEVRTIKRQINDASVTALFPPENVTLTSVLPRFAGDFQTFESGSAELIIDGSQRRTWNIRKSFDGTLTHNPSIGLSEGSHSYKFKFTGLSGLTTESETKNFTVNTSKASELNISIQKPEDGSVIQSGDVNLKFETESTGTGTAKVFLDRDQIAQKEINAGTQNTTVGLINPETGDRSYYVTVNKAGTLFSSDTSRFTIRENVSFDLDKPENDGNIESAPIIFNGTISTSGSGLLRLNIDGKIKGDVISIDPGDNQTYEFTATDNISAGKHSYTVDFVSDSGRLYPSETRTFNLELGTTDEGATVGGGILKEITNTFIAEPLGIGVSASLNIVSLIISILIAGVSAVFVDGKEGMVFGFTMFSTLTVLSIAGLFPLWIPVGIIVVGGGLFAFNTFA